MAEPAVRVTRSEVSCLPPDREREQRLHALTSAEEHYALRWLAHHMPDAFDRAADYVEKIRALDATGARKEARETR